MTTKPTWKDTFPVPVPALESFKLDWSQSAPDTLEARIGTKDDGVLFWISYHPTCYRRGPYSLNIEVCGGPNHHKWGCFDEQDQPTRYYHNPYNAFDEAERIAKVLIADREAERQREQKPQEERSHEE